MAIRSRRRDVDVAVLGGGPAGSFAALLLVRRGLTVAMIDPDLPAPRLEGLSPRVLDILRQHALADTLDDAPCAVPRQAHWNGDSSARNIEHLVERDGFDRSLRFAAAAAGAICLVDRVRRVRRQKDRMRIELAEGGSFAARLTIDARGRRAPRGATRWRGPATLSAAGWGGAPAAAPGTQIAACRDGWLWWASKGDGRAWVQASFDARLLAGRGEAAVGACLQSLLAQAREAGGAPPEVGDEVLDGWLVRYADTQCNAAQLDPQMIRIGDAAMSMDPLSGHGLFWALSSALSVVPIVAALIDGSAEAARLARRFYEARLTSTFWRQARLGRDFYRAEQRFGESLFWSQRRRWPDDRPAHDTVDAPHFSRRVVVDNNRLREADVVVTDREPDGVAWVAGLPIAAIARRCLARRPRDGQALDWFHHHCAPEATREQAAVCFAWLRARGLLPDGGGGAQLEGRGA